MDGWWLLTPEYVLGAVALGALFGERGEAGVRRGAIFAVIAAVAVAIGALLTGGAPSAFGGLVTLDPAAQVARTAIPLLAAVWLLHVAGRGARAERANEAVGLALISAVGGMLVAVANDLIVLFICLELATMPAYVLTGYRRDDARGLEGALKYFLLSMLTTLLMLYGFSFIYGFSGSTNYLAIDLAGTGTLGLIAFAIVLVGLFAKLSAAPFHFWTPDAYAGAPAQSVAFVSTIPKVAGAVALVRLVAALGPDPGVAFAVIGTAAAVSMVLGNLAAFPQGDVRRLMAYSGIAHTGYLLLALASGGGTTLAVAAAIFYAVAYAAPSMAVLLVAAEEGSAVDDFAGLVARRPATAWAMVVWLVSLIGIPPLAGFFGKLYLFSGALADGQTALVVVAIIATVISAGYYFRIIRTMFFSERAEAPAVVHSVPANLALAACLLATIALGVASGPVMRFLGVGL